MAIVSSPYATDYVGMTQMWKQPYPWFVMRARDCTQINNCKQGFDLLDNSAAILLHEFGHTMDLRHTGNPNADSFWSEDDPDFWNLDQYDAWLAYYVAHIQWLETQHD